MKNELCRSGTSREEDSLPDVALDFLRMETGLPPPEEMLFRRLPLEKGRMAIDCRIGLAGERRVCTLYLAIAEDTVLLVRELPDVLEVLPRGDLCGAASTNLADLLVAALEQGYSRFRFDLKHTAVMDHEARGVIASLALCLWREGRTLCLETKNARDCLLPLLQPFDTIPRPRSQKDRPSPSG